MPTDDEVKAFFAGQNNQQNTNNNQQPVKKSYVTYVKDGKSKYLTQMSEGYNPYENIQTFSDTENDK